MHRGIDHRATCRGDAAKKPLSILILLIGGAFEAIRLVTFYYQAMRAETLSICQATIVWLWLHFCELRDHDTQSSGRLGICDITQEKAFPHTNYWVVFGILACARIHPTMSDYADSAFISFIRFAKNGSANPPDEWAFETASTLAVLSTESAYSIASLEKRDPVA
ncbi:hypothetical protein BDV40DRAFT_280663 [Aspergillus tamarii]|uniref:Uncharacterized protein n=1 Tax=Aspergillus tamarii TaxID=41984 RepID=A0A5N6UDB6_ASPTM|nr:hypothetical protein BDV40DRAFT_280663 [Aspergillus tamarii]